MRILLGDDERVADFVARLCPIERPDWSRVGFTAIGIVNAEARIVGGAVFSDWRPEFGTIELSGAAIDPRAFGTRKIIRAIGAYPFGQLEAFRVWARTATANKRARDFLAGFGFREEGVSAHHYGLKRHAVTLRLLRPEWLERWGELPPNVEFLHNGQRRQRISSDLSTSPSSGPG
jgi:RimJ/RimL family protein N-acetyltransferase